MNNEKVKVKCTQMDEEGKGIVKVKGREIHIPGLITGESATIEPTYKKGSLDARIINIDEKSEYRTEPACSHYKQCGGCQLQHMSYDAQSEFKQNVIEKLMKNYHKVNRIITMQEPYNYRNKIHSSFSYDAKKQIVSGIYEENTHHVIMIDNCMIQDSRADKIILSIRELLKSFKLKPYDEDTGSGFLRHVLVKTGYKSGQIMVVLVAGTQVFPSKNNFVSELLKKHPEITTIVMNINNRKTSMVLGNTEKVLYGNGYIEDTLCGCVFQISPRSFYQINPIQTEKLYYKAIEMAKLNGNETVFDAYSGIGTISIILSSRVKNVLGVELNKDAVKDAVKNAKINKITNTYFYCDDAGDFMLEMAERKQKADVVFMDPPRSGSDEKFLSSMVRLKPQKIVYISCNPVTQERDLRFLTKNGYTVMEIQPVDMFPQTFHVECIVMLEKKGH